ncbi:MAG: polyprenyl synthetase family protein [Alphaproteobacteria bacterium]|nr:polyprenyl synthetase family protein [Alphaproteobacteria bacterium]
MDMEAVNEMILARAASQVKLVPDISRYLIEAGGKRLRPMLTLGAAQLFGASGHHQINYAAAVEFMHTATLLHDDVVDESEKRRGKPAARMVWGNQASVLVGDYLLGQAFMMMVEAGDLEALGVLSQAAATIAEGEVFQLVRAGDLETSEADYFAIIEAKTAALFAAATEVGALAAAAPPSGRAAVRTYGRELGIAFQLTDDLLDFGGIGGSSGSLGKNVGDDLRDGKLTLPMVYALGHTATDNREFLVKSLGNREIGEAELARVIEILRSSDGLAYTLAKARKHSDQARAALEDIADSPSRSALNEVVDYNLRRAS